MEDIQRLAYVFLLLVVSEAVGYCGTKLHMDMVDPI
jgi:hypothetical protein